MWLALIKAVLAIAESLAGYVREKQLMDAGAAKAVLAGIQSAQKGVADAEAMRDRVRAAARADPSSLRRDDGAKRKP